MTAVESCPFESMLQAQGGNEKNGDNDGHPDHFHKQNAEECHVESGPVPLQDDSFLKPGRIALAGVSAKYWPVPAASRPLGQM